jgi:hypothetical protein
MQMNRRSSLAVAALAAAMTVGAAGCSSGTTYKAKVVTYTVINPADLAVVVQVTNTGTAAGTPECQIDAEDASYAYHGFDDVTLKGTLQPGQTTHFADNIVITRQGAQYVSQATVKCS